MKKIERGVIYALAHMHDPSSDYYHHALTCAELALSAPDRKTRKAYSRLACELIRAASAQENRKVGRKDVGHHLGDDIQMRRL